MIKSVTFIFLFSCLAGQVQYDPKTGEPIERKKFDPNTGEELEQKFDPNTGKPIEKKTEGMMAKLVLVTGDIIQGKLISQDKEKIIVESEMVGTVTVERVNIKSLSIGGVPMSSRRSTSAPVIKENASTDNGFKSQSISSRAKREAVIKNDRLFNTAVGTGACLNPIPYITIPVMGLAIMGDVGVSDPESKFYKDLEPKLKKQYKEIYIKEIKKLRRQQCFAPANTVVAGFAVMFGLLIFMG
tara:strand:+ start:154 stop:879 length:726 start_codon:yes stop_codon:yes gene_type:complete